MSPPNSIQFLYANACSVRNKWAELASHVELTKAKLVCITESWLAKWDQIPAYITQSFHALRTDRGDGRQGGGVLILLERELQYQDAEPILCTPNVQLSVVLIEGRNRRVAVACVYRSPLENEEEDVLLLDKLDEIFCGGSTLSYSGTLTFPTSTGTLR